MKKQETILHCSGLKIGYDNRPIYDIDHLSLERGKVVCLLGQNGVGKSTLMKTLAGILPPLEGDIVLAGKALDEYSASERAKRLGIVTTDRLSGNMSVLELLMAGRFPHQTWFSKPSDDDFAIIRAAISQTNIDYLLEKKLYELSDGQRQKVMIARALSQDGDLILLDEPTAHLDLANRVEVMRLLRQVTDQEGKTLIVSTHELNLALQFCDEMWLMDFGVPMISGSPEDLALSGTLNAIFHHNDFEFDLISGKVLPAEKRTNEVAINGNEEMRFWIMNALDRAGIMTDKSLNISAKMVKNRAEWQATIGENTYTGIGIDELILHLKQKA